LLSGWTRILDAIELGTISVASPVLRDAVRGGVTGNALAQRAATLQNELASYARQIGRPADFDEVDDVLERSLLLQMRADDPAIRVDREGRVTLWPNRASVPGSASAVGRGPLKAVTVINGRPRPVLRFDGESLLESARQLTPAGTLFVVFQSAV